MLLLSRKLFNSDLTATMKCNLFYIVLLDFQIFLLFLKCSICNNSHQYYCNSYKFNWLIHYGSGFQTGRPWPTSLGSTCEKAPFKDRGGQQHDLQDCTATRDRRRIFFFPAVTSQGSLGLQMSFFIKKKKGGNSISDFHCRTGMPVSFPFYSFSDTGSPTNTLQVGRKPFPGSSVILGSFSTFPCKNLQCSHVRVWKALQYGIAAEIPYLRGFFRPKANTQSELGHSTGLLNANVNKSLSNIFIKFPIPIIISSHTAHLLFYRICSQDEGALQQLSKQTPSKRKKSGHGPQFRNHWPTAEHEITSDPLGRNPGCIGKQNGKCLPFKSDQGRCHSFLLKKRNRKKLTKMYSLKWNGGSFINPFLYFYINLIFTDFI